MGRWKPERCNCYWVVDFGYTKKVKPVRWNDDNIDTMTYNSGNCFKTEAEAQAAAEKVRALLLSLHEPVTDCSQLPKLTAEVFDRPDCPEDAKIAVVNEDGSAFWGSFNTARPTFGGGWDGENGSWFSIPGKWDSSDWQNSLIERPSKSSFDRLLKNCAEQQVNKILSKAREHRLSEQYHNGPEETTLPDWCKVGEWVYLSNAKYYKIKKVDSYGIILAGGIVIGKYDIHAEAVSARLRPYNAEEMKALVGKVIEKGPSMHIVTGFENVFGNECMVNVNGCLYGANDLLRQFTIDNKPAGVLEHLENGEWVE